MKNDFKQLYILTEVLIRITQISETHTFIESGKGIDEAIEQACKEMNYNSDVIRFITEFIKPVESKLSDIDL